MYKLVNKDEAYLKMNFIFLVVLIISKKTIKYSLITKKYLYIFI